MLLTKSKVIIGCISGNIFNSKQESYGSFFILAIIILLKKGECMNIKSISISTCEECPNFDFEYYSYAEECRILNRRISPSNMNGEGSQHNIPDDCPLEDYKESV